MNVFRNHSCAPVPSAFVRRAAWGVCVLLCASSLLACGAKRVALPAPVLPLVSTPDATFRKHPPVLSALVAGEHQPPPPVRTATLANGLTVWVVNRRSLPYVALSLCARDAGSFDNEATPELLRLTTRSLVEGGLIWSDGNEVEPPTINGEQVSFRVSPTHSKLELRVLKAALGPGLDVLARTVRYPAFAGGKLDAVRLREVNDMSQGISMSEILLKTTVEAGFGLDIAQRLVPMRLREVIDPPPDAVQKLYRDTFQPQSSALIAVGDATLEELLPTIEKAFGDWTGTPRVRSHVPPAPKQQSDGRSVHFFMSVQRQAQVLILQAAPPATETQDELPFALLSEVAIGAFRSHANTTLRHDAGLTYGVRPSIWRGRRASFMTVEASFDSEVVPRALESLLASLSRLQTTRLSEADMVRGKTILLAEFEAKWGGNRALADYLGHLFAEGKTADWLTTLPDALAAVTAADVQRVAKRYLHPDNVEIGVVGEPEMAADLSFFGQLSAYSLRAK